MYEVTVVVIDSKGNSDEQDVTVKVTNIEEDGVVTLSTLQPRVGFPVTATLTDPDNVTADSVSWQWYNGTINTNDLTDNAIEDATSDTYTPAMDDITNTVTARATYIDGFGDEEDAATGERRTRSWRTRATKRRYSLTGTWRWTAGRRTRSEASRRTPCQARTLAMP